MRAPNPGEPPQAYLGSAVSAAKQWVQDNGNTAVDAAEPLTRRVLGSAGGAPSAVYDAYNAKNDLDTGGLVGAQRPARVLEAIGRTATQGAFGRFGGAAGLVASQLPDQGLAAVNKMTNANLKFPSQIATDNREAKARMAERSANGGRPFTDHATILRSQQ